MVLRHQSLLQEGQCVVLQLAGSVIGGEELYEVLRCFHRLSLRGIHERPSITETFEDSNVRTRGRAETGFEDILEDHLVDMMAAGQSKQASSESCSIRMQAPCTMPVFEAVVSKQKAMILS
ncbi:hypothetical protein GWK47_043188 [Chionoecetes opilio]|uniref:Uncharacterized protein n=1 Tax=Chionoecetes opilio TaxID=41210 RepID=A0A8J5CJF7_CHIOP|nr:hypothetical protein GWK47_043188 [Chionoecetes opilio]